MAIMSTLSEKYFAWIKHFLPEKTIRSSLGLDIGTSSCKAIELIRRESAYEVLGCAIEPIVNNDVTNAIKRILPKFTAEVKSPNTAVGGKGTLIRYLEMPKMPPEDLRKSLEIESDKHFPFAKEQIYTDCHILDLKGKDNKMPVIVAASKKEIVDQRIQLLLNIGLQPEFVSLNAIAVANVFNVLKQNTPALPSEQGEKATSVAVLDIGNALSTLIILKDNLPLFTRDIFIGGRDFNKRISNSLSVNMDDAEKIKCQPQDKLQGVLNACDALLTNLVSETRLSFDYFVTENNTPISKLYLTGGSSLLEGAVEYFTKNLDLPVEKWNPFSSLKFSNEALKSEVEKNAATLAVALGLAFYPND